MAASQDGDESRESVEQESGHGSVRANDEAGPIHRRSASPAKRSAAAMEDDEALRGGHVEEHAVDKAGDADMPPAYGEGVDEERKALATLDEQVTQVTQLAMSSVLRDGEKGYLVSHKWLAKVYARSSVAPPDMVFGKEALQGEIGKVDNSHLVSPGAFSEPHLRFEDNATLYIPIREGLSRDADFEVLPEEAWNLIMQWYGLVDGQLPIIRFAHDTAPKGAVVEHIQYDISPPVFTVRRMLSGKSSHARPPTPPITSNNTSQTNTSHTTPEPEDRYAVQIVASRHERFQSFLARSKKAAGIPREHKVKVLRQLDSQQIAADKPIPGVAQPGMPTPQTSRSPSPVNGPSNSMPKAKLVVDPAEFSKMEAGTDYEMIDMKDETANEKYNGTTDMETLSLFQDATLIFEEQVRGPGGGHYASDSHKKKTISKTQPNSANTSRATTPAPSGPMTRGRTRRDGRARGTVGLTNLGNTCYMNSALQCISRVEELAIYFLHGLYKSEINVGNPLGYNGKMAKTYASLLEQMYQEGSSSAVTPKAFKSALAQAQPMFSGYGQQDSQEFLSFLVDALHEDLNRIQKKPYIENPDSDDKTVHDPEVIKQLGETYRANYRARNHSIAMDLFNGFYKNTMVCPECAKVSVTFDPYSLLTLQLPIENAVQHDVYYFPNAGRPSLHHIDLDRNSSIRAFKQYFAKKVGGVDADRLIVYEVWNCKVYKVYHNNDMVGEIAANDTIYIGELPEVPTNVAAVAHKGYRSIYSKSEEHDMESKLADHMAVTVISRIPLSETSSVSPQVGFQPTIIMITREEAKDYDAVLMKVLKAVARLTSRDLLASNDDTPADTPNHAMTTDDAAESNAGSDATLADTDGKVSDRSVPSEDEYVDVTLQNGPARSPEKGAGQLKPGSFIQPLLRNIFEMKYALAPSGEMQAFGTSTSFEAKPMSNRVRKDFARRNSTSSAESTLSHSTDGSTTGGTESRASSVSDHEMDAPDLIIGSSELGGDAQSDEDLPSPGQAHRSYERRNKTHANAKARRRKVTYGRRNRRSNKETSRPNGFRPVPTAAAQEDDPYYIKLGEVIVLDWNYGAFDAFFGGSPNDEDDFKGYPTSEGLEITKDSAQEERTQRRTRRRKDGISLEECFAETAKTETLSEENAWYCNRCKELRRADKTLEIWTLPDILVIHLKRFSGERYSRNKVDVLVDFPLEGLDLSKRVGLQEEGKDCIYDLFAVDNHYGGLGGGHYTAMARNFFDGKWYDFNDSIVGQRTPTDAVTPAAYLLFYRRRSSEPLGPPELRKIVERVRNPDESQTDPNNESDDDAFPGEGRLGDPQRSSRLLGSSSDSQRAGAGNAASQHQQQRQPVGAVAGGTTATGLAAANQASAQLGSRSSAVAGAGSGAANLLPRSRTRELNDDDEGIDMGSDDDRAQGATNSNGRINLASDTTWGFQSLDNNDGDDLSDAIIEVDYGQSVTTNGEEQEMSPEADDVQLVEPESEIPNADNDDDGMDVASDRPDMDDTEDQSVRMAQDFGHDGDDGDGGLYDD